MVRPFTVIGFTIFFSLAIVLDAGGKAAIVLFSAAVVAFVVCMLIERARRDFVLPAACLALVTASLLAMGAGAVPAQTQEFLVGSTHRVKGTVVSLESKNYDRFYNVIKVSEIDGTEQNFKIRLSSKLPLEAQPYDVIEADLHLYNLGEKSTDARNYYLSQNVYVGGYRQGELVISPAETRPPEYYLLMLRQGIKENISKHLPNDSGAVATALLIGDKSSVSKNISADFSKAGISHLIAVSGLHLSVWGMFLLKLFSAFKLKIRLASLFSSAFVILFMAVSGFSYSVMRSGFMMLVMLLGNILSRRADSLNSLGFALTLLCFLNPYCALNTGLWLSFLSTLGIVVGYKYLPLRVDKYISRIKNRLLKRIAAFFSGAVKSTVFACAFTLPLMILEFERVSMLCIIANISAYIPAVACMLLAGFSSISSFVPLLSFLAQPLAKAAGLCSRAVIEVAGSLADSPYAYIRADGTEFVIWLISAFVILAAAALISRYGKRITFHLPLMLCALSFALTCAVSGFLHMDEARVTVADVGNGTAVVVEKDGEAVLIGCGGDDFYALSNIERAIDSSGGDSLKFLLVPRVSQGESALCADVIRAYRVENALLGQTDSDLNYIFKYTPHDTAASADIEMWDGVSLHFQNEEHYSCAVLDVNGVRFLITFKPSVQKDAAQTLELYNADVLIAREKVPDGLDCTAYELTVLSSDYAKGYLQQERLGLSGVNALATAAQGNIRLTVSNSGKLYAQRVS